ncbi:MAG: sugar-binding transcriptional regulator, partial [Chloroflexota bacterium]
MSPDKNSKLADIAEWYYVDGLNQSEIARKIGVDRSMVSRLLAEARQQNIVEIRIRRPISANQELEDQLEARFNLLDAHVLINSGAEYTQLLKQL